MEELCVLVGAARCRRGRYEDLVTDTRATLAGLLAWLGLELEEGMLRHHELMDG